MASFLELYCDQGTDYSIKLDLTNDDGSSINVQNYVFNSSVRKSYYSQSITANLTISILDSANGTVRLSMNAATTANIKSGRYLYDVKMAKPDNTVSRVLEGIITVSPQITK